MTIQRYAMQTIWDGNFALQVMVKASYGDFVLFSDHEAAIHQAVSSHTQVLTEISMALDGPDPHQEAELVRKVKAMRESHARLAAAMREIVDEEPCDPSGRPIGYCLTHMSDPPCVMVEARAALADALKLEEA